MTDLLLVQQMDTSAQQMIAVLENEPNIRIGGCVESAADALSYLARDPCDVLLVDYDLPGTHALHLVRRLTANEAAPKVLITGVPLDEDTILRCFEEGAAGYVSDNDSWADLVKKVRAVDAGEFILDPNIAAAMMARIAELKQLVGELDGAGAERPEATYAELTPREREVLRLLGQDLSNQEIAEALTLELGTVKNHVHNLLRKLDVCSRKQAAQLARQMPEDA